MSTGSQVHGQGVREVTSNDGESEGFFHVYQNDRRVHASPSLERAINVVANRTGKHHDFIRKEAYEQGLMVDDAGDEWRIS